jgi:uncharacterized protein with WD repeat
METDEVIPGQWLLNKKINTAFCDLSPDGQYFMYNVHDNKGAAKNDENQNLTVISKPLYFSALHACRADITWSDRTQKRNHGGVWMSPDGPLGPYVMRFRAPQVVVVSSKRADHSTPFKTYVLPEVDAGARKIALYNLTVVQLKQMCEAKKVSKRGLKENLINKLVAEEQREAYEAYKDFTNRGSKVWTIGTRTTSVPFQVNGKLVWILDGWLVFQNKRVRDLTQDSFQAIPPPEDYDW